VAVINNISATLLPDDIITIIIMVIIEITITWRQSYAIRRTPPQSHQRDNDDVSDH
jgi:hypothetical protein